MGLAHQTLLRELGQVPCGKREIGYGEGWAIPFWERTSSEPLSRI